MKNKYLNKYRINTVNKNKYLNILPNMVHVYSAGKKESPSLFIIWLIDWWPQFPMGSGYLNVQMLFCWHINV